MAKRIDRFIDSALFEFAKWLESDGWRGKERDCINLFVMRFMVPKIGDGAAIFEASQIRIEGGVPQPTEYVRRAATKDLVIWRDPLAVAWDAKWKPENCPWVVLEWKTRRKGKSSDDFDEHDVEWLTAFTSQNPGTFGYAITVDFTAPNLKLHRAKFSDGVKQERLNIAKSKVNQ